MKLLHKTNSYYTHAPVLIATINRLRPGSRILELGTGEGSTALISHLCNNKHYVVSVDHDAEWISRYTDSLGSRDHEFKHLSFDKIIPSVGNFEWDLVFLDQGLWESRAECLMHFKDTVDYIILHDCDYYPMNKVFGRVIEPIVHYEKPGIHTYDDVFKEWKEFYPPLPWPGHTGPPTLLGSNRVSLDFEVDWDAEEI